MGKRCEIKLKKINIDTQHNTFSAYIIQKN